MKNSGGQSITIDTLCFPVSVIQKVLIAAEQKKVLEQQVGLLNERISGYEQTVKLLTQKDSATIASYELQIKTMKEQRVIFESEIKSLTKSVKKERRKRFWTAMAGVASTGIVSYLYITK